MASELACIAAPQDEAANTDDKTDDLGAGE
jgi:hypothetical protein